MVASSPVAATGTYLRGRRGNGKASSVWYDISKETKQQYQPFIRGYHKVEKAYRERRRRLSERMGAQQYNSAAFHAGADPDRLLEDVDLVQADFEDQHGEQQDDNGLSRRSFPKPSGDHYEYFTKMVAEDRYDDERVTPLCHARQQRTIMRCVAHSMGERKPNTKDVVAKVNSTGGVNILQSLLDGEKNTNGHHSRNDYAAAQVAAAKSRREEIKAREACESLRFLVFGAIQGLGSGKRRQKESGGLFEQRCGTREEVVQLQKIWNQLDEDGSGDVDFNEFVNFFGRTKADRHLGYQCVRVLIENRCTTDDEGQATCKVEDMMKLIWLKAGEKEISLMMGWFREAEFDRDRVKTPPVLPPRKRRAILDNFPPRAGYCPPGFMNWMDVKASSLMTETMLHELKEKCDPGQIVFIEEDKLLEVLCPNGYRAHNGVTRTVNKEGLPLIFVENEERKGWVVKKCLLEE